MSSSKNNANTNSTSNSTSRIRSNRARAAWAAQAQAGAEANAKADAAREHAHPTGLVPLADYRSPGMPAEHVVRAMWRRLKERFSSAEPDPVRADNRLQATTLKVLDEVVAPPACGPLLDDFDAAVRAWVDEPKGSFHCVVVLAPCDSTDLIGSWAQSRGHAVLCAPDRSQGHALTVIPGAGTKKAPAAQAEKSSAQGAQNDCLTPGNPSSLLVIPRLESWFLRRRNGLLAVRALLAELQQSERRCLIGCNSWAWAFLVRAAGAALVLPSPRTFVAFDAKRLQAWFSELATAQQNGMKSTVFRLAHSGADVLETKNGGVLACNYLQELAARSNGIPWVAWHLWRDALRTGIDAVETRKANGHARASAPGKAPGNQAGQTGTSSGSGVSARTAAGLEGDVQGGTAPEKSLPAHERTFWITSVPDPDLPHHQDDNALLVLHALLIHGALDTAELLSVLPDATAAEVLPALLRSGFLEKQGNRLAVKPAAYPALRRALLANGFPMGAL